MLYRISVENKRQTILINHYFGAEFRLRSQNPRCHALKSLID